MSADVFYEPQRVASVMDAAALGALIATTAPNIQYFTRYRKPGGALAMLCRRISTVPCCSSPRRVCRSVSKIHATQWKLRCMDPSSGILQTEPVG